MSIETGVEVDPTTRLFLDTVAELQDPTGLPLSQIEVQALQDRIYDDAILLATEIKRSVPLEDLGDYCVDVWLTNDEPFFVKMITRAYLMGRRAGTAESVPETMAKRIRAAEKTAAEAEATIVAMQKIVN